MGHQPQYLTAQGQHAVGGQEGFQWLRLRRVVSLLKQNEDYYILCTAGSDAMAARIGGNWYEV